MRISIRELKRLIKEQVEEGWEDAKIEEPHLNLAAAARARGGNHAKPNKLGGWSDRDSSLDDEDSLITPKMISGAIEKIDMALRSLEVLKQSEKLEFVQSAIVKLTATKKELSDALRSHSSVHGLSRTIRSIDL